MWTEATYAVSPIAGCLLIRPTGSQGLRPQLQGVADKTVCTITPYQAIGGRTGLSARLAATRRQRGALLAARPCLLKPPVPLLARRRRPFPDGLNLRLPPSRPAHLGR